MLSFLNRTVIHMKSHYLLLIGLLIQSLSFAQTGVVEGYVFEKNNRGFINKAKVVALDSESEAIKGETISDAEGKFKFNLALGKKYIIVANHRDFLAKEVTVTLAADASKATYAKIEMERKPGYIFDVTIAELTRNMEPTDAISGTRIEIYNNTSKKEELVLEDHQFPTFKFNFLPGNHYTVMIRKKGFLAKRLEAYVDVDGCILCFDGLGRITPNVTDVMTNNNQLGTFLANVELEPIVLEKTFQIENIYYDFDKSDIRPDAALQLDKVVSLLEENPSISVELGSHTDSRGRDAYNMSLSERRAASAVAYIVQNGIASSRITSRGYGETQIANQCTNGVTCSDADHERNRRTVLKITGIDKTTETIFTPLKRIIEEDAAWEEVIESKEIMIKEGEELPEELKKDLEKQKQREQEENEEKEGQN